MRATSDATTSPDIARAVNPGGPAVSGGLWLVSPVLSVPLSAQAVGPITSTPSRSTLVMVDRYGQARSPQPMRGHTCQRRRQIERGWKATSQDDCPGCKVEREEGWQELLASIGREVFVNDPYRQ